ncbi:MAG: hypothetical protein M3O09_11255 [Acidobacteriota bacterium]|nr:hypothetical protein [Acidobacteriota bacterium]
MSKASKNVPISELRTEPGSEELVRSDGMKPYLEVLKADISGRDTGPALAALAALPLEQRYVWRVISALKWGLCDLDTESVAADVETLSEQELKTVAEPLALRAMQLSLFIKALVGEKAAREIMLRALACQGE